MWPAPLRTQLHVRSHFLRTEDWGKEAVGNAAAPMKASRTLLASARGAVLAAVAAHLEKANGLSDVHHAEPCWPHAFLYGSCALAAYLPKVITGTRYYEDVDVLVVAEDQDAFLATVADMAATADEVLQEECHSAEARFSRGDPMFLGGPETYVVKLKVANRHVADFVWMPVGRVRELVRRYPRPVKRAKLVNVGGHVAGWVNVLTCDALKHVLETTVSGKGQYPWGTLPKEPAANVDRIRGQDQVRLAQLNAAHWATADLGTVEPSPWCFDAMEYCPPVQAGALGLIDLSAPAAPASGAALEAALAALREELEAERAARLAAETGKSIADASRNASGLALSKLQSQMAAVTKDLASASREAAACARTAVAAKHAEAAAVAEVAALRKKVAEQESEIALQEARVKALEAEVRTRACQMARMEEGMKILESSQQEELGAARVKMDQMEGQWTRMRRSADGLKAASVGVTEAVAMLTAVFKGDRKLLNMARTDCGSNEEVLDGWRDTLRAFVVKNGGVFSPADRPDRCADRPDECADRPTLAVEGWCPGGVDAMLRALATRVDPPPRTLRFVRCFATAADAATVIRAIPPATLGGLTSLHFTGVCLEDCGVDALVTALACATNLQKLAVKCAGIRARCGTRLLTAVAALPVLRKLDVCGNPLGPACATQLAAMLERSTSLKVLRAVDVAAGEYGLHRLLQAAATRRDVSVLAYDPYVPGTWAVQDVPALDMWRTVAQDTFVDPLEAWVTAVLEVSWNDPFAVAPLCLAQDGSLGVPTQCRTSPGGHLRPGVAQLAQTLVAACASPFLLHAKELVKALLTTYAGLCGTASDIETCLRS